MLLNWIQFDGFPVAIKRYKSMLDWYEHYSLQPSFGDRPPIERGLPVVIADGMPWVVFPGVSKSMGPWRYLLPTYGPLTPRDGGNAWHRHVCYQLRLTKRALPEPSREMFRESAEKLRTIVTSYVDYPILWQSAAREFSRQLSSRLRLSNTRSPEHTVISESACLECPKAKMGNKGWFLSRLARFKAHPPDAPLGAMDVLGRPVYTELALDVLGEMVTIRDMYPAECFFCGLDPDTTLLAPYIILQAFEEEGYLPRGGLLESWDDQGIGTGPCDSEFFSEDPIPHRCRACIVLDSGGKARAITVHSAKIIILLHYLRTHLYRKLASIKAITSLGGEGSAARGLISWDGFGHLQDDEYFLSLDLSNATDTFPTDLSRELLYGFLESFDGPNWLRRLLYYGARFACSPVILDFSEYDLPEAVSERAIFMGTPTSWSLLNIMQMFLLTCADILVSMGFEARTRELALVQPHCLRSEGNVPPEPMLSVLISNLIGNYRLDLNKLHEFYELCGDDLVALVLRAMGHNYLFLLEKFGMIPSAGTNGLSKVSAVFTETQYHVRGRGLWWEDHIKPKSLVDSRTPGRSPGQQLEVPSFVTRGVAASDALKKLKKYAPDDRNARLHELSYRSCCWLVMACNRDFILTLRRFQLPVYLPRQFGGAEFPHFKGFDVGMRHELPINRRLAGWLVRSDSTPEHAKAIRTLSKIWNPWTRSQAGRECARLMDHWFDVVLDSTREFLRLEDVMSDYRTTSGGWAPTWIRFEKVLDFYSKSLELSVADLKQKIFSDPVAWRRRFNQEWNIIPLLDAASQRETFFRKETDLLEGMNIARGEFHLSTVAKDFHKVLRGNYGSINTSGFDISSITEEEVRRLMWWTGRMIFVKTTTSKPDV